MQYKAFHKLSYGLYIIASEYKGKKAGYIGNTAFQVTSNPPQLAISCHKDNATMNTILNSGSFSLSVLKKESDTSVIGEFGFMSSADIDKFRNVEYITAATGAPVVLNSSIAWFDCKVVSHVDAGSHVLIISEVVDSEVISGEEPLTYDYYREKYRMLAPKNAPTYIEKEKLEGEGDPEPASNKVKEMEEVKETDSAEYACSICGYHYNPDEGDPAAGIPPGTPFEDLPEDYTCPVCNADKDYFNKV